MPVETVPVFIRLAELPAAALVSGGLREVILNEAETHGHRSAADVLRVSKRPYLVLLDGLDEVRDEATRVRVCRWLEGEIDHLPDARFAVTCRYAAWQRKTTLNNRFLQVDVLTLDDERVRLYVGRWFQSVVRGLRGGRDVSLDACDREAREGAEGLVEVLFRTERTARMKLLELTRNPLLLSTICLVYYKRKKLPKQRDELYSQCVELLVETWTERRGEGRALPYHPTRLVLEPLAWAMHERQPEGERAVVEVSHEEIEPLVARAMEHVRGLDLGVNEFLDRVRDECGLLMSSDVGRYRFVHLTFQEYLASLHAVSERKEALLADRAGDPRWQEVILLAAARGGLFVPFVAELARRDALAEHQGLLRECLEDTDRWSSAPFVTVFERLRATQADEAAWAARGWWQRLWDGKKEGPRVTEAQLRSAAAVFTIARGHEVVELRALAELWSKHASVVGAAARAYLGASVVGASNARREPVTGMPLVWIPPGRFLMGATKQAGAQGYDPEAYDNESPVRQVELTRGFYMGVTTVTNAAYGVFLRETGAAASKYWRNPRYNAPEQPVVGVSFDDATAFCAWLSRASPLAQKGLVCGLPTEAQWEYAARGTDGRRFPRGNDPPDASRAPHNDPSGTTAPVGTHSEGRSPFGCEDMGGNVWEWCLDHYNVPYPPVTVDPCHLFDKRDEGDSAVVSRVLRGGAWVNPARELRCASRRGNRPRNRGPYVGFRVVVRGFGQHGT
jgi:formylglycine-generating enzyme required for sulfatase activity